MDPHSTLLRRRAEHVAGPPDAVDTMHILLIDSQKLYGFGKLMYPWRDVSPFCRRVGHAESPLSPTVGASLPFRRTAIESESLIATLGRV